MTTPVQSQVQQIKTFAEEVSRLRSVVLLSLLYAAGSELQSTLGKVVCFGLGSTLVIAGVAMEVLYLKDAAYELYGAWGERNVAAMSKASISIATSLILLIAKTSILWFSVRALIVGCQTSICADALKSSSSQSLFNTENLSILANI